MNNKEIQELASKLRDEVYEKVAELHKEERALLHEQSNINKRLNELHEQVREIISPLAELEFNFRSKCASSNVGDMIKEGYLPHPVHYADDNEEND